MNHKSQTFTIICFLIAIAPPITCAEPDTNKSDLLVTTPTEAQQKVSAPGTVTIEQEQYNMLSAVNSNRRFIKPAPSLQLQTTARSLIKRKQYKQAISLLVSSPDLQKDWEKNYWLGTAYLLTRQLAKATQVLDHALKLKGNIPEIWIQRAIIEQEKGNANNALKLLAVAQNIDPESAAAFLNAGYAYEQLAETENAHAAYNHFLKLTTNDLHWASTRQHILLRLYNL